MSNILELEKACYKHGRQTHIYLRKYFSYFCPLCLRRGWYSEKISDEVNKAIDNITLQQRIGDYHGDPQRLNKNQDSSKKT